MQPWAIIAARFLSFGSALILFGSSLFYLYGLKGSAGLLARRWGWPHLTLLIAAGVAMVATIWWLMAETVLMTDDPSAGFNVAALASVLSGTTFGKICILRLSLLTLSIAGLLASPPSKLLWGLQAFVGAAVVTSFVLTGHGMVNDGPAGSLHVIGDVVHLLAAGVWLGALLPLAILVLHSLCQQDAVDAQTIYHGLDGFSGIGLAVVAILILTGLINSWFLIGLSHWRELFTTAYGIALLVKLGLFFGMLALAALNRFHLTPRLNVAIEQGRSIAVSLGSLRRSVLIETGLALFVLAAVSVLGTLEPPISGG